MLGQSSDSLKDNLHTKWGKTHPGTELSCTIRTRGTFRTLGTVSKQMPPFPTHQISQWQLKVYHWMTETAMSHHIHVHKQIAHTMIDKRKTPYQSKDSERTWDDDDSDSDNNSHPEIGSSSWAPWCWTPTGENWPWGSSRIHWRIGANAAPCIEDARNSNEAVLEVKRKGFRWHMGVQPILSNITNHENMFIKMAVCVCMAVCSMAGVTGKHGNGETVGYEAAWWCTCPS